LIEWAARVASGSAINLIIEGVTGSGKTYTACAALSWLAAEHRIWGMFISVSNLLMQMKREFDHEPEGPPILDQCFRTDVLALDDLGLGRNTEWVAGQIDQIFDGRYARERPTIITTNFTTQEILRVFDERVARRIYEDSLVYDKPGVYRGKGQ
jgi:DNA replication protein DnaC